MTAAVHASAPDAESDLFAGTDAAPGEPILELVGELIEPAQVRTALVGEDRHPVPVLWLNLRPASGVRRTIHAEQIYTEATRKDAEALAAALPQGARVTLTTSLTDMRILLPHVQAVALTPHP